MNPLIVAALAGCATAFAIGVMLTSLARRSQPWYPASQGIQLGLIAGSAVTAGMTVVALALVDWVLGAAILLGLMLAAARYRRHIKSATSVPRALWLLPRVLVAAGLAESARGGQHVRTCPVYLRSVGPRGVRVRVRIARGRTAEEYEKATILIASGMRISRANVRQVRPGVVDIHLLRNDPLRIPVHLDGRRISNEVFVGVLDTGEPLGLDLFSCPAHLIAQGQTRSGKTNLLQVVLRQIASNNAVVVAGCDITGLLLAPFADHKGNEYRHTGTANIQGHVDALARIVREMDRRIESLLSQQRDKLTAFGPGRPLILVMLDEFAGLLEAARMDDVVSGRRGSERLAPQVESCVARLVAEGLKAGIRVVIGVQRAEANLLGGATRSNIAIRLSFRVDNRDSVRLLHPDAPDDVCSAVMRSEAGVALVSAPFLAPYSRVRLPHIGDFAEAYFQPILAAAK